MKAKEGEAKKIQIEENSSDSDDTEALKQLREKAKGKTKTIDAETLQGAKAKAAELDRQQAMQQIPKTAAGFEKDFNALKKDPAALLKYLK